MFWVSTSKGEVSLVIVLYDAITLTLSDAINQYIVSLVLSEIEPTQTGLDNIGMYPSAIDVPHSENTPVD